MSFLESDVFELAKRCPKNMKNGPCGSSNGGRCEIGGLCAWTEIYEKLKGEDKLSILDNVLGTDNFGYSPYSDKKVESFLDKKGFVITTEIDPPKGVDLLKVKEFLLNASGVDAVNVVDNPLGNPIMSGLFPALFAMKYKKRPIYQVTCRDRNILGIQSDIFSAYAAGVRDILVLTGDFVTKYSKPVFDVDSTILAYLLKTKFPNKLDFTGKKIDTEIILNVGVAVNPNSLPLEIEMIKFRKKMHFADFAQTQAVFDPEVLSRFAKATNFNDRILVGILPITSYKMAMAMAKVPGVRIPDDLMAEIKDDKNAGVRRAKELVGQAKELGFRGVHIMTFTDHKLLSKVMGKN